MKLALLALFTAASALVSATANDPLEAALAAGTAADGLLEELTDGNPRCSTACPLCGKRLSRKSQLLDHLLAHQGEKPFACDYAGCRAAFTQHSNLKTHRLVHTDERLFRCPEAACDKAFKRKAHLEAHHLKHSGHKSFVCRRCKRPFAHESALKRHHFSKKPCQENRRTGAVQEVTNPPAKTITAK